MCKYHDIYKDCNICIYMMNRYVDKLRILLCSVNRKHCIAPSNLHIKIFVLQYIAFESYYMYAVKLLWYTFLSNEGNFATGDMM